MSHIVGKSIIITGAGGGFGRLAALRLGAGGALVACLDIDGAAAQATAHTIRDAGGRAIALVADVARMEEMREAAAAALAAHGAIDVMVNNAGVMPLAFVGDHAEALPAWHRAIDINFTGTIHGCLAVHDQMIAQGRGHIVNISSIYANRPTAGAAVYGATKAAVDYFTHALRQEARGRIKLTLIKPTGVMGTGLGATVVNREAGVGIVGENAAAFYQAYGQFHEGNAPASLTDPEDIANAFLAPDAIAEAIVHAIAQPWGVAISDMTVRASGDYYLN